MKSNKQPTYPDTKNAVDTIPNRFPVEDIRDKLIEVLPKADSSLLNLLSRAQFIQMMNGVMERISELDDELKQIEEVLLEREKFDKMAPSEKIRVYRAIEKRQATMRADAIRVTEIGSRTDFNRSFFGIQAQLMEHSDRLSGETEDAQALTMGAKQVLSQITKLVTIRAGKIS